MVAKGDSKFWTETKWNFGIHSAQKTTKRLKITYLLISKICNNPWNKHQWYWETFDAMIEEKTDTFKIARPYWKHKSGYLPENSVYLHWGTRKNGHLSITDNWKYLKIIWRSAGITEWQVRENCMIIWSEKSFISQCRITP